MSSPEERDERNDAQDILDSTYGCNAKGELVYVGKLVTPATIAWMDQMQKQKEIDALIEEFYDVESVTVATGELYVPGSLDLGTFNDRIRPVTQNRTAGGEDCEP